jgi:hypothetical protein
MVDGGNHSRSGESPLPQCLQGLEKGFEVLLSFVRGPVAPSVGGGGDYSLGERRKQLAVIPEVEPPALPPLVRGREDGRNILRRLRLPQRVFYVKADEKKRENLKTLVLSPLSLSFGLTRPLCRMTSGSPCQQAMAEFRVVFKQISTRDLVQEYLSNKTSPTLSEFSMPKLKGTKKGLELVRLPYRFKFEKQFKEHFQEWLEMIEIVCNEVLGNYTKKRGSTDDYGLWHPTKAKVESGDVCLEF